MKPSSRLASLCPFSVSAAGGASPYCDTSSVSSPARVRASGSVAVISSAPLAFHATAFTAPARSRSDTCSTHDAAPPCSVSGVSRPTTTALSGFGAQAVGAPFWSRKRGPVNVSNPQRPVSTASPIVC